MYCGLYPAARPSMRMCVSDEHPADPFVPFALPATGLHDKLMRRETAFSWELLFMVGSRYNTSH